MPARRHQGEIIGRRDVPAEQGHCRGEPAESRMSQRASEAFEERPGEERPQRVASRPARQTSKQRNLRRTEQNQAEAATMISNRC